MRPDRKTLRATTVRALDRFVEQVGDGQHRPQQKFIRDALVGLQLAGDTTVASWAKELDEPIGIKHCHKRLCRNLGSRRFNDGVVRARALEIAAPLVRRHADVIGVDDTDVSKTFGRKMPHQWGTWDGSKGEEGFGWNCIRIDAVNRNGNHIPLYARLYNSQGPEFQNRGNRGELELGLRAVVAHVPKRSVWVFDRGYDSAGDRKLFGEVGINFVVRLGIGGNGGQRRVVADKIEMRLRELVQQIPMRAVFRLRHVSSTGKKMRSKQAGWVSGLRFQPSDGELEQTRYSVVVTRNLDGSQPIVLVTNQRVQSNIAAQKVAQQYHYRWGTEVGHRLVKRGGFDVENLRSLTWRRLKRLVLLVFVAFLFLAWMLLVTAPKIVEELMRSAPATGRQPVFRHGRLRRWMERLLARLP